MQKVIFGILGVIFLLFVPVGSLLGEETIDVSLEPVMQSNSQSNESSSLRLKHETLGATRSGSSKQALTTASTTNTKEEAAIGRLGVVVSTRADIKSYPVSQGQVLYTCPEKTYLALLGQSGDWYGVLMIDGSIGWIEKKHVNLLDYEFKTASALGTSLGNRIVTTALKYLGVPYKWGGYSASGLDCSGFVKSVFAINGINLPRVSRDQAQVGTPVGDWKDLRPGDRLYFACNSALINHTGIYIGNGLFIHSSSSRQGVAIDSILSPFYARSLVAARRSM